LRSRRGSGEEQVWIDLRAPGDGAVQTLPLAMIEVSGATGAGRLHFHDVAIVIDLSASTRLRSGVDVNENGVVGKASPEIREDYWGAASPEMLCDDPGDTIAAAEIAAVRRLLKLLNPERTRVALIAFGDRAELVAKPDATRPQVDAALDELDKRHGWYGGTNYAAALDAARDALLAAPDDGKAGRKRSILFLSDGYPTLPPPEPNPGAAIAAARRAGRRTMRIHSRARPEAVRGATCSTWSSRVSNGTLTEIERPGRCCSTCRRGARRGRGLENQTANQPGRVDPAARRRQLRRLRAAGLGRNPDPVRSAIAAACSRRSHGAHQPAPVSSSRSAQVSRLRQVLRDRTVEVELAARSSARASSAARSSAGCARRGKTGPYLKAVEALLILRGHRPRVFSRVVS
jgi:hypothetical protein